jgi:ankyrin repeat protein
LKDIDLEDMNGEQLLPQAAKEGHEATVELLLETGKVNPDLQRGWNHQTPLVQAVEGGSIAVVQLILGQGVEIDYVYTTVSESNDIWIGLS